MSTATAPGSDTRLPQRDAEEAISLVLDGLETMENRRFEVRNPATGETIARVPDAGPPDFAHAVSEAHVAGREWARTSSRRRSDILRDWYANLLAHSEQLAALITFESGKPIRESRAEVRYGLDFVRWFGEELLRSAGTFRPGPNGDATYMVQRAPVGLAVAITPWNFPLAMATRKIAPALAAGCAMIVKPSELTPLTTAYAVALAFEAGVPEGILRVVNTTDPSAFSANVLRDARVRKVSFTGSGPVGRHLLGISSENVLRTSMELGGNAPLIVFDDAHLERAVEGAYAAKMRNGGQSCIAANRIFVQDGIATDFLAGFEELMGSTRVGNGFSENTDLGPLIDHRAVDKMKSMVDGAVAEGAAVIPTGSGVPTGGSFYGPTVLDRVASGSTISRSEIFGPVAAVQRFSDQADVLRRANDTDCGLAAYVFTEDLDRAFDVADELEAGIVGINQGVPSNAFAPFGGVKASGLGREGGSEGLEEYQETRFYNLARRDLR